MPFRHFGIHGKYRRGGSIVKSCAVLEHSLHWIWGMLVGESCQGIAFHMNDHELIEQARRGDVEAFNQLVLEYQQLAYNVAYRIVGDQERAADATQEGFLRSFRRMHQFHGGSFKAWLLRIVTNCAYDELRANRRRPATPIDDLIEDEEHTALVLDESESPEQRLQRSELDNLIQRGLATLPPDQRTVVILSDIEGLSYEEIAEITLVSLGTVKSRLSRARAKMRDYLLAVGERLPSDLRP